MGHGSLLPDDEFSALDAIEKRVARLERRYEPDGDIVVDEACLPPPGSLVRPGFRQASGGPPQPALLPSVHFPGGVIVASLLDFCSEDVGSGASAGGAPSRNASAISLATPGNDGNGGTSFDDPDNSRSWSFRPVDDFGCIPGVAYGIFYSSKLEKDGSANEFHLESRSSNPLAAADPLLWVNGGSRHHNLSTTPDTLRWGDEVSGPEFPELDYYTMMPVGGEELYGDWPFQTGGGGVQGCDFLGGGFGQCQDGMAFDNGEVITVKPWIDGGGGIDAKFYLDHLVFIPKHPFGVAAPGEFDVGDADKNFQSSALTVFGYYVSSGQPASVTEPGDDGVWFTGDTVDDDQILDSAYDPDAHWTIAGYDEADAVGLFSGVGGVHVYVLCRITGSALASSTSRYGGHVTCYTGTHPLADILCDECGNWVWGYAGKMPLGDSAQASFGMIQWRDSQEVGTQFSQPDSVRTSFVAFVPQSPCDAYVEVPADDDFLE